MTFELALYHKKQQQEQQQNKTNKQKTKTKTKQKKHKKHRLGHKRKKMFMGATHLKFPF